MPLPRFRQITLAALLFVCVIIVTGASVRLTGSGLGCSEWPACTPGSVVAPLETHALIEFGNRLVTGLVAIPVGMALVGSFLLRPYRRDLTWLSAGLVAGVAFQAVLGGILVRVELAPAVTSAHFLSSMVLVWNAVVLYRRAGVDRPAGRPVPVVDGASVTLGRVLSALATAVLVSGTIVTGTGPHAGDERAARYGFALVDVARNHSLAVWAFLLVAVGALWRLTRAGAPAVVDGAGRRLVAAIVLEGALGYAQYASGVPPYLVIVHVAGAVAVFVATLWFHLSLFAWPEAAPAPELKPAPVDGQVGEPAPAGAA